MKPIFAIVLFFISIFSLAQHNGNTTDPNTSQATNLDTSIGAESNPEGQEEIDREAREDFEAREAREAREDNWIIAAVRQFFLQEPHYQRYQEDLMDYVSEFWRNPQDTVFTPRANQIFTGFYGNPINRERAWDDLVRLVGITLNNQLDMTERILRLTIAGFTTLTFEQRRYMEGLLHIDRQNFNIPFRSDPNLIQRYLDIIARHQTLFVTGLERLGEVRHWPITQRINTHLTEHLLNALHRNEVDFNPDPIDLQILFEGWYQEINPEATRPTSPIFWENNNITERYLPSPTEANSGRESPRMTMLPKE